MSDNKSKFIGVTEELKGRFKALLQEFNVMPVAPIANVAPVVTPTPEAKKFGEATLKDGTVVKWEGEQLVSGVPLLVIDPNSPEGFLPAPDGNHEMQDGTVIVVEGGLVKEVKAVAPVAPEVAPVVTPDMTAQFSKIEKDKEALEVKFNAEIESLKKSNEELTKFIKGFTAMFSEAMDTPMADPIETPANAKPMSKADKMLSKIHGK